MVFLIVKYRRVWGKIGVKRCQNWSQIGGKKVPKFGVSLGFRMRLMESVSLVLVEFKMGTDVRLFDCNV